MGSFSLLEIVTIAVVVLIVFGPDRLPELARKAGELIARARHATRSVTSALEQEYGEAMEPIKGLRDEIDSVRSDLSKAITSIGDIEVDPSPSQPDPVESDEAEPGEGERDAAAG